jgi:hypothetical protein
VSLTQQSLEGAEVLWAPSETRAVRDHPERAENVMRVLGARIDKSTAEDDLRRLFRKKFRTLDKIRKLSIEKRRIDPGVTTPLRGKCVATS